MESDSFFWQLFKYLPETLFPLVGRPVAEAAHYRYDAPEIKKSYRLDGLFVPSKRRLPLYFVEVEFRRKRKFWANLFAKVFSYLEKNNPDLDWVAVALFDKRATEPKKQPGYQVLLASRHVRRIYLDEVAADRAAPPGLTLLKLVSCPKKEAPEIVAQLLEQAQQESDGERADRIVELVEGLLLRRFTQLDREEVRAMFQLHDLRESKVWQQAHAEGIEKGMEKGIEKGMEKGIERGMEKGAALANQRLVRRWAAKGKSLKEIADLLELPLAEVRRLAEK